MSVARALAIGAVLAFALSACRAPALAARDRKRVDRPTSIPSPQNSGHVDLHRIAPGSTVRDPYTGKVLVVPEK